MVLKKITVLLALALCVAVVAPATAHVPEGAVRTAFQWPAGLEPTLDGDLSEWSIVPEDYLISFAEHTEFNGEKPADFGDLNFRSIVGWSESTNSLYFMMERFDDFYDRDAQGGVAGGDDSWEMHVDGDHSGDQMRFGTADIENEEERALAQGRWSQSYHTRFPNLGPDGQESWSWFWMTQAQWHDELPYADHGFRLDGEIGGGEATAFIEVRRQAWDDFLFNDPEGSVIHDYNEGDITGLGWAVFDSDVAGADGGVGQDAEHSGQWSLSGATDVWKTTASATDFLLAPVDPRVDFSAIESAVEENSWGRIKSAFVQ